MGKSKSQMVRGETQRADFFQTLFSVVSHCRSEPLLRYIQLFSTMGIIFGNGSILIIVNNWNTCLALGICFSSLSSHALLIRLTSLKVQIKLKLNFIFITHRPYWPTHSAGNSSLSQLQGGSTQGDALQLLGLPGHCKDGLCGDGRYDDDRRGYGRDGRYADGGCGHCRDGEPIAWWILVCIPSFTSCSVDKNLFRSAAVSWDTALAVQALVAHSLANSGKLA